MNQWVYVLIVCIFLLILFLVIALISNAIWKIKAKGQYPEDSSLQSAFSYAAIADGILIAITIFMFVIALVLAFVMFSITPWGYIGVGIAVLILMILILVVAILTYVSYSKFKGSKSNISSPDDKSISNSLFYSMIILFVLAFLMFIFLLVMVFARNYYTSSNIVSQTVTTVTVTKDSL